MSNLLSISFNNKVRLYYFFSTILIYIKINMIFSLSL